LLNKQVHDETLAFLGSKMGEREVEILAANQARLLQYPAIIEEIYLNKQARMSTVNRLLELAVRHGLRLDRLPMYEEIAAAILGQAPPAAPLTAEQQAQKDEELDANFKEGMEENAVAAMPEKQDIDDKAVEEHEEKIKNLANAPIMVKIRRASLGTALDRSVLIKDPNKLVAMSAIKAPAVNEQEAIRYASNRSLLEDVIRYIANKKEWHKNYLMKVTLVNNPKCPLPIAMRFLTQLRPNDVKLLARSKNIPASLCKIAKEMSQKKK
jgi:hypothetical protein